MPNLPGANSFLYIEEWFAMTERQGAGLNGGTGLAMFEFEQRTWRALAGVQGVVGGQVLSIATSADDLYIGGDFASVAGVSASGLAICKHFRCCLGWLRPVCDSSCFTYTSITYSWFPETNVYDQ